MSLIRQGEGEPMLFDKEMEPRCAYCERGTPLEEGAVLCIRRGVVAPGDSCRAFRYDPFKRVPPRPAVPDFSRLKDEDFTL